MFVATNICRNKSFVVTKIFCRDKHTFVVTKHQHVFVAIKMILVAAPARDSWEWLSYCGGHSKAATLFVQLSTHSGRRANERLLRVSLLVGKEVV